MKSWFFVFMLIFGGGGAIFDMWELFFINLIMATFVSSTACCTLLEHFKKQFSILLFFFSLNINSVLSQYSAFFHCCLCSLFVNYILWIYAVPVPFFECPF